MDQLWLEFVKSSPTAIAIGMVVWLTMRDQSKILRSIDLRMAKVLEQLRKSAPTPAMGVPQIKRHRTHGDSDDPPISLPRTITDEDLDR
jgi:hypothetical protein